MIRLVLAIIDFSIGSVLLGAYGAWVYTVWKDSPDAQETLSAILRLAFVLPLQEPMARWILLIGIAAIAFGVFTFKSGSLFLRRPSAGSER